MGKEVPFTMKKFLTVCALLVCLGVLCACQSTEEQLDEDNPMDFSYDMLDLSAVADEIYAAAELSDLAAESVETVTDETTLTEQYYLDLSNVRSMEVRSANGKYGVADVALIWVTEDGADAVIESLERRKDDRIAEFSNFDVYDSYSIAVNADIYKDDELVIMLMLSDEAKSSAKAVIESYLE